MKSDVPHCKWHDNEITKLKDFSLKIWMESITIAI